MRPTSITWTSYLFTGTMALLMSWMLTGCRFGNNVEEDSGGGETTQPTPPSDQVSGFYVTVPRNLQYCVQFSDPNKKASCVSSSVHLIPSFITEVIVNPVAFAALDYEEGRFALFDYDYPDQSNIPYFEIFADKGAKTMSYLGETGKMSFWDQAKDQCTLNRRLALEGSYSFEDRGAEVNGKTIGGKMDLQINVGDFFEFCDASLSEMAVCYEDQNKCFPGNQTVARRRYQTVRSLFEPFVESGAIHPSEIAEIEFTLYEVQYE